MNVLFLLCRKVYSILTLQLIVTFGIMSILYFPPEIRQWVNDTPAFIISVMVIFFAVFFVLLCVPNFRRKAPWNIIVLMIFTACEGVLLGCTCSYYDPDSVIKAMVLTIILVIGLTLFAFQVRQFILFI